MNDAALRRTLTQLQHERDAGVPVSERLVRLEALRPAFEAARSPLLRAQFVLLRAGTHESRDPLGTLVADLELALLTFAANRCAREQAQCLAQLGYWYNLMGHEVSALAAARAAMRQPELPASDRLALFIPVAMAYAHQLRLGDAWQAWEQDFAPLLRACHDERLVGAAHGVLASLHFFEALRARRVPSVYTLDLGPGPEDTAGFALHMAELARHGRWSPPTGPGEGSNPRFSDLRGMAAALRGDLDELQRHLALPVGPEGPAGASLGQVARLYNLGWAWRVAGHPDRALTCLQVVRTLSEHDGPSKQSSRLLYDLSCCHALLGDWAAAHRDLQDFLRMRAELAAADLASLGRLQDLLARAGQAGQAGPSATRPGPPVGVNPVTLQQSEPPYLARLQRLLVERLGQRPRPTELAAEVGVSLRTLQAGLQRYRGTTLTTLQRRLALQQASELLRRTDRPVKTIASQCGFPDAASFTHAFRREFGVAPTAHRRHVGISESVPATDGQ